MLNAFVAIFPVPPGLSSLRRLGWMAAVALLASGCAAGPAPGGEAVGCPGAAAAVAAPKGPAAGSDPDFALYGFPKVTARGQFSPGREMTITAGPITLVLPPDLYTEPLTFELLTGDESMWQSCIPTDQVVIVPYAYRVTNPANGQQVGRFDKPVSARITDPRIAAPAIYWLTSAANPPSIQASSSKPAVEGQTITVTNPTARAGWFTTAPRR